jgi:hypothetical protein
MLQMWLDQIEKQEETADVKTNRAQAQSRLK